MSELSGVLTSELKFNAIDYGTPMVYELSFLDPRYQSTDEKELPLLIDMAIRLGSCSGGVSAKMIFSPTLKQLVGNQCKVTFSVCDSCNIEIKFRVKNIGLYEGYDKCFPYLCGKNMH